METDLNLQDLSQEQIQTETLTSDSKEAEARAQKIQKIKDRNEKICKEALRNIVRVRMFWTLVFMLLVLAMAFFWYWYYAMQGKEKTLWANGLFPALLLGSEFIVFSCARIIGSGSIKKRLLGRNKCLADFPKQSTPVIRELYLLYCERRCLHFWTTLGFGALFLVHILYVLLGIGIDAAVNTGAPKNSKIFQEWDLEKFDWSHYVFFIAAFFSLLNLLQYFMFKSGNDRIIKALEDNFGREKLVDECMYCHKMHKVNFRYKTVFFIVVCFQGCLFYLLFKRMLCTIFDKSFLL
ncbi:hypothetical protein MHSWG343_01460 [Candidatus Mycoplasma haematohominis]|uniref:Uncharacterized protein n=1 Tax=Candidatus Mycoplasma haematohominis TaxID=1494318 RepID=A0A478FP86_9MOLU|nr:hypothetical protein MHSWG343_01460 [Candidatus Mycoplasma haemohominis]